MANIDWRSLEEADQWEDSDGETVSVFVRLTDGTWDWRRIDADVLARHNPDLLDEIAG